MTPIKKAKELIDMYVGFSLEPYDDPEMGMVLYKAKKNALICVSEMKKASLRITRHLPNSWVGEEQNYYSEIEKEIKDL